MLFQSDTYKVKSLAYRFKSTELDELTLYSVTYLSVITRDRNHSHCEFHVKIKLDFILSMLCVGLKYNSKRLFNKGSL
jgi:hypothetical protein